MLIILGTYVQDVMWQGKNVSKIKLNVYINTEPYLTSITRA